MDLFGIHGIAISLGPCGIPESEEPVSTPTADPAKMAESQLWNLALAPSLHGERGESQSPALLALTSPCTKALIGFVGGYDVLW